LEVRASLSNEAALFRAAGPGTAVEPGWLKWVPSAGAMGVVSLALQPTPEFWDSAFALADRVERVDPARANLAPSRARVNLLTAAAGVRPELDVWPHLKGITASVIGEPDQPGCPTGAVLVLHADRDASALRLAADILPRLCSRLTGQNREGLRRETRPAGGGGDGATIANVRSLGSVNGRPLTVYRCGRDVVVAWGEGVLNTSQDTARRPELSVAHHCTGWERQGKRAPQRVAALWPARCFPAPRGLQTLTPAYRVLTDDPPVVWWGWTEPTEARDTIECTGLRDRTHRFLDQLALEPPKFQ
jgi:hypothetical protein